MKTWLLTWNPKRYAWDELNGGFEDLLDRIHQVGHIYERWSTGVNISIKEGDRAFLIRLGVEPRGIIASGHAATNVFRSPHWELHRAIKGDISKHIYVEFDKIVRPQETPLPMSVLKDISPTFQWSSQSSGINIPQDIAMEMECLWK